MALKVKIPKFDKTEENVKIVQWHVREGDRVHTGDILFDVETEKAVLEVESQADGVLLKINALAGQEAPVLSTAAFIGEIGEPLPD